MANYLPRENLSRVEKYKYKKLINKCDLNHIQLGTNLFSHFFFLYVFAQQNISFNFHFFQRQQRKARENDDDNKNFKMHLPGYMNTTIHFLSCPHHFQRMEATFITKWFISQASPSCNIFFTLHLQHYTVESVMNWYSCWGGFLGGVWNLYERLKDMILRTYEDLSHSWW